MSEEKIKLRVPADDPEGFGDKNPYPEYISQGNHAAELPRGEVIEVASRPFADWLVRTYDLEDLTPPENPVGNDYPEDFPRREVPVGLGVSITDLRTYDRDALIAIDGIGAKTADAILEYFAGEAPASGAVDGAAADGGATTDGGNE